MSTVEATARPSVAPRTSTEVSSGLLRVYTNKGEFVFITAQVPDSFAGLTVNLLNPLRRDNYNVPINIHFGAVQMKLIDNRTD